MAEQLYEPTYGYALSVYGVAPEELRVEVDEDLRATVVTITSPPLSEDQIAAIWLVLQSNRHVTFTDPSNAKAWELMGRRIDKVRAKARAETMRRQMPDLPVFDRTKGDLAAFAREAERYCGYAPGSVAVVDGTVIVLHPTDIGAAYVKLVEVLRAGTVDVDEVWIGGVGSPRPDWVR